MQKGAVKRNHEVAVPLERPPSAPEGLGVRLHEAKNIPKCSLEELCIFWHITSVAIRLLR